MGERLEVHAIQSIGRRLFEAQLGRTTVASSEQIREALAESVRSTTPMKFSSHFLWTEWNTVIDPWQLSTWEQYRDVKRLGRKARLSEQQRAAVWGIFERARAGLCARALITESEMFTRLAERLSASPSPVFDYVVIDEAQDMSVAEMRLIQALGGYRVNALFFAGDLGQRIFQQPFSWKELGVDVRGRASRLRINYRTSHQIREQADRLLAAELSDVDGITEERRGTISAFNGVPPQIAIERSEAEEVTRVSEWIRSRAADGLKPHEIAIFVRSSDELPRAQAAAERAGFPFGVLDARIETHHGRLSLMTMHLAKGLEFRAVAVMACDEEVIPLQSRIESAADESDLEDVYGTERHLLYVACTRARDYLLVTGVSPASEFLQDLVGTGRDLHSQ